MLFFEFQDYGCAAGCFVQSGEVSARTAGCHGETNSTVYFEVISNISGNTVAISESRVGGYTTDGDSLGSWVKWSAGDGVKITKVVAI